MQFQLIQLLILVFLLFHPNVAAKSLTLPGIEETTLKDSATGRDYIIYIKLPDSYDAKSEQTYPVVYISDSQLHFEIISGSLGFLMSDVILVGVSWQTIPPPELIRSEDYTPGDYPRSGETAPTGKGDEHLAFYKNDLFKYVEARFKGDPSRRSYYGYSASATFGVYTLLTAPETFRHYLLGSPTTLIGQVFMHESPALQQRIPDTLNANVFVSVGSEERPHMTRHAFSLVRFLKEKTRPEQLAFHVIDAATHASGFPMSAIQSLYWLSKISRQDPQ